MNFDFEEVWERLSGDLEWDKLKCLSDFLGCTPGAVSSQKKRGWFPTDWAIKIAMAKGLSTDWLLTGKGPHRLPMSDVQYVGEPSTDYSCPIVDEPELHLTHETDFVQEVVKHVLSNRDLKPPKSLTRRELELLYIFNKISKHAEILEDFEQTALECLIKSIHEEMGIYNPETEEFTGDPDDVNNY